ncbi:MAG: molybdate ABC transporter substrate-binding protein [Elusimicrobiota bacterium]
MPTTKAVKAVLKGSFFMGAMLAAAVSFAERPNYLPPWNKAPTNGFSLKVAPFDYIVDLHGDATDPQLTIFFAGNQFMAVPDLVAAFRKDYPEYKRIYVETLPPGKLAAQIEHGALIIGNLRISAKADVYTDGAKKIAELQAKHHWFKKTYNYARNRLAIMVRAGNPKNVKTVADLGRPDVRVSMPNPRWEGIARAIESMYRKAGGNRLDQSIMVAKVKNGSTWLTVIHHRQTPLRILDGKSDAGPVWYTEAYFQQNILRHPIETITIPVEENIDVTYAAAILKAAPHPRAAEDFLNFLSTPQAQEIYSKYGFELPKR